ncbi:ABC transporter permease [Pseudonocardia broussonetiae]|uniref:FtsX-like permease family protein n=1 Tax=Pseudonocardia broussonetiae TaxID=2736640 RepID=A0A6M6JQB0_9PSEU|nr:FtsX-like permease family protein [Pseudonocardia broussonetiae]QJY48471.1 FtsX-like permease family protein [Pseudonocardia broussonetiae]
MALIGMWLRLELRRRWRSLLVLALLVALAGGVVLTAVAGARRGDSALDRLLARTLPATLAVLPNQAGFDWDAVRALPGVAAVAEFAVTGPEIDGIGPESIGFPYGAGVMDTIERPVVLEGRLADPARADEAVISPAFAEAHGLGIGDVVDVRLFDPATVDATATTATTPAADGPVVPTRIVGTVRSFWFSDAPGSSGGISSSPGLLEQYRANLLGYEEQITVNALVRLTDGAAGVPAFQAELAALTGRTDISSFHLADQAERTARTTAFESGSLLAFGLAALAAAVVLVGQAVARYAATAVADLQVLQALGLPRRHALVAAAAPPALAGVAGALLAAAAALAASAWFPFGTAAIFEPEPGPDADALVIGLGAPLLAVLVAAGAAGAARLATAAQRSGAAPRRSAVAAAAARAGLPVPVLVGTRFALEPGRGRSALPVRPALVGAVTGVLGVLAALTFSAGVAEAAQNPARFGQTHAFSLYLGFNGEDFGIPAGPVLEAIAADPDAAAALDARSGVVDVRGAPGSAVTPVTVYSFAPVGPDPYPAVLTAGRLPERPDEIVLAPATAEALGAEVGDRVTAPDRGAAGLTVVGTGFVPNGPHNNYDEGGFLSDAGYDELVDGFKFHLAFVALRPGVDPAAVQERLAAAGAAAAGSPDPLPLEPVAPLTEAAQLRNVEVLPVVLGLFLALLAVGAVGHALATAVRRRRHDVAVLRALGMTRGQCRAVVVTQATVLAAVGLLFGVPLGLALGRVLWRLVADITPLQYVAPVALLALLLAVPAAVLVANALAAWPGHLAARLRIGHVLRAE